MLGVGVGLHDILTHQPEGLQAAIDGGFKHLRDFPAGLLVEFYAVELLIPAMHPGVIHLKITGALMGLTTHVRGTLHVVLTAQRIHSDPGPADVAGHHGQVGDQHHGAGSHLVFGHPEAVETHRGFGGSVFQGGGPRQLLTDSGDAFHFIQVQRLQSSLELRPVFTAFLHKLTLHQAGIQNEPGHHVQQRHIGAGAQLQVIFRIGHQLDLPRINHDQRDPFHDLLFQPGAGDRVAFRGIRANHHDAFGELQILKGIGGGPGAKTLLHAPRGGGVADPCAAVDVVGAHHRPDEFLHQIVLLVGAARRGNSRHRLPAVFIFDAGQILMDVRVGFLPRGFLQLAIDADERLPQPVRMIEELERITSLQTGVGVIHFGIHRSLDREHFTALGGDGQIAAHPAIGANGAGLFGGLDRLRHEAVADRRGRTGL